MLVINPDECIDCGVCEIECPVKAIKPESEELINWIERAKIFAQQWPKITSKKSPLLDADQYQDKQNKFEQYMKNSLL